MNRKLKYKRLINLAVLLLATVLIVGLFQKPEENPSAFALTSSSYDTYTMGKYNQAAKTQTAYLPSEMIMPDMQESNDFYLYDDMLFIADSKAGAVRITDLEGNSLKTLGLTLNGEKLVSDGTFGSPNGIYVRDNIIYVADRGKKAVVRLNFLEQSILDESAVPIVHVFEKPTSPLFGANFEFVPMKIVVDESGNMYITGEGNVNGIIHLNVDGEFEGYLGANTTPFTITAFFQNLLFSAEQKKRFLSRVPPSPNTLAIDNRNLLFSVTTGTVDGAIRLLNTSGVSLRQFGFSSAVAIDIDESGIIYSVESSGHITIHTADGLPLFIFGGSDPLERFGSLKNPVAIQVLDNGDFLVLDRTMNAIIRYAPTDFFTKVSEAVRLYTEGRYLESEPLWEEIHKLNANFVLVYRALAQINMKKGNYALSLEQFRMGEDVVGYSEAFWYVRNDWLQKNTGWMLGVILLIAIALTVIKQLNKRTRIFAPINGVIRKIKENKTVSQILYSKYYIKHPGLAIEQMRYKNKLTVRPALIMYLIYIVISLLSLFFGSYIFFFHRRNYDLVFEVAMILLPILLAVVCNYFVSSVTDGEGKFRFVFIAAIYSLTPILIFRPILIFASYFLTLNEAVLFNFFNIFMWAYSAILIVYSISKVHFFRMGGTLKNIILTVFAMAMALLFIAVVYLLVMQLFNFLITFVGEMFA